MLWALEEENQMNLNTKDIAVVHILFLCFSIMSFIESAYGELNIDIEKCSNFRYYQIMTLRSYTFC